MHIIKFLEMEEFFMFCERCGKELADNQTVCPICGTQVSNSSNSYAQTESSEYTNSYTPPVYTVQGGTYRSVALSIFLTFITCGLYGIYWYVCLTDEMNRMSGRTKEDSGLLALLFALITCGIYAHVWAYRMGTKRDIIAGEKGYTNIAYTLLSICGLSLVVYALAQDAINDALDR
jgi:hypothetical protein